MATASVAENHHSDWKGPRKLAGRLAGPAILFLLCCGVLWKLALTNQYTWLEGSDLSYQVLPWYQFQAGEWHAGRMPLWDPYHWGGQPLIGQAQPGAAYPFNWILFSLPLKEGWLRQRYLHGYFVLIHFMGALFAYLLCRDLRLSRVAAVMGGLLFSFTGFVGSVDWPQMLNGAIWAPLVILFLLRVGRGENPTASAALAGAFLGMSWLSGHHQTPIFLTLTAGGAWLYYILRDGRIRWNMAGLAALSMGLMIACGALQLFPAYEYGKLAYRWVGAELPVNWKTPVPYSVHQHYSLRLMSIFGIVFPGMQVHVATFSGMAGFVLAVFAAMTNWRNPAVRFLAALVAGALLVSLGYNSVFHGVLYAVAPMIEKARMPASAFYLVSFAIAILAAFGINGLTSPENGRTIRKLPVILAIFGAAVLALSFTVLAIKPDAAFEDRYILTGLVALLLALVFRMRLAGGLSATAAAICCSGLVLLEIGNFAGYTLPHREEKNRNLYLNRMAENADLVEFLRRQQGPFRIEVDDQQIPFNFGDWHGIEAMGGYLASLSANLIKAEMHSDKAAALMNVRYSIGKQARRAGEVEVFAGKSGLKIFENPSAMPRAWSVHEVDKAVPGQNASAQFSSDSFDFRRKTFLEGALPALEQCSGEDEVQVVSHSSDKTSLLASMRCRGIVILSETYFPGWIATVDGAPAEIREAYGVIRGVVVGPGTHVVEMKYRPKSVLLGAAFSAVGFLLAGFFALRRQT